MSSPAPIGPASKVYTIPPRPKPGRKPKEPAADDVRKEQNRAAQKKFRNKQHDKIQALTEEIDQKNATIQNLRIEVNNLNTTLSHAHVQMEAMRQQVLALETQMSSDKANHKRQTEDLRRESKRVRTNRMGSEQSRSATGSVNIPIPSSDSVTSATPGNPTPPYEMEIDFTNFGQPTGNGATDECGFCDGGDFCACAMKIKSPALNPLDSNLPPSSPVAPLKQSRSGGSATAPGTCEACQRDPEQARKCQELAQASKFSPTPPTAGTMLGIKTGPDGLLNEPIPERTTCSDFLAKFRPLDTTQYRTIIGRLHSFPHMEQPGRESRPFRPALDLDAKEAAEALTSLAATPKRH
ncbi:hypothetical protein ANO11243_019700 [Dothideomycetidae sp. 11243]|nr:hypothetical protein ANO11243_019700 [fungal sp. No.11243]